MFGGSVFIDQLPENNKNVTNLILTRPFDLSKVIPRKTLRIYTTPHIKASMVYNDKNDLKSNIITLPDLGVTFSINLPRGKTLLFKFFPYKTYTMNVIAVFEFENITTLYTSRMTATNEILKIPSIKTLIDEQKIDKLYVDAAGIELRGPNQKYAACTKIKEVLDEEPQYQFNLVLDDFGYEDLLVELANQNVKIYLDAKRERILSKTYRLDKFTKEQSTAQLIVCDKMPTVSLMSKRYRYDKIATMLLTKNNQSEIPRKQLYVIEYTPSPTLADIHYFTNIIDPLNVYAIEPNGEDSILTMMQQFCRNS